MRSTSLVERRTIPFHRENGGTFETARLNETVFCLDDFHKLVPDVGERSGEFAGALVDALLLLV